MLQHALSHLRARVKGHMRSRDVVLLHTCRALCYLLQSFGQDSSSSEGKSTVLTKPVPLLALACAASHDD